MPPSRRCCVRADCAWRRGRATRSIFAHPTPTLPRRARCMHRNMHRRPVRVMAGTDEHPIRDAGEASLGHPGDMVGLIDRNVEALIKRREQEKAATSREEKVADAITAFAGSMNF